MLQVKIFEPMERAALETAVNDYLAGFHQAASPREIRISRIAGPVPMTNMQVHPPEYFWATLTVESVRRDLASNPSGEKEPPPLLRD